MQDIILFPSFLGRPLTRLLALLDGTTILTENEQVYTLYTPGELASLLLQEKLLLFVSSLGKLPEKTLEYLIDRSKVWCTSRGDPTSAQFSYKGGKTRWITSSKSWGYQKPTLNFMKTLRTFFNVMDIGTTTGPGGTGLAKLRQSWSSQFGLNWKLHRHQRPTQSCCLELGERGMGGRSDVLTTETFDWAWELDRKNAYGADFSEPMPTGPALRFRYGHTEQFKIYAGECQVTIPEDLCYGLFPMRDSEGQLYYPTRAGIYQTWLWSCQVDLCKRHGLGVIVQKGWGWYETTTDQAVFVKQMEELRDQHPEIEELIKLSLVATIGRLGMDNIRYFLSREGDDEKDIRVGMDRRATDYFLREEIDYKPQSMPHWYWYVMALASSKLTEEGYTWAKKEMLIATNTDAVILKKEADTSAYISKDQSKRSNPHSPAISSGTWRSRRLNKVTVPALRHLVAETETGEKIDKRPGSPYPLDSETGNRLPRKL